MSQGGGWGPDVRASHFLLCCSVFVNELVPPAVDASELHVEFREHVGSTGAMGVLDGVPLANKCLGKNCGIDRAQRLAVQTQLP
jgi:hypothetical protein